MDVDFSLKSKGGKAPAPADAPFVTIGHVIQQLSTAFATPFENDPGGASEVFEENTLERWDRD